MGSEGGPKYDGSSDRFWMGDHLVPRTDGEAEQMGLHYDHATRAWWCGDTFYCYQSDIDAYGNVID